MVDAKQGERIGTLGVSVSFTPDKMSINSPEPCFGGGHVHSSPSSAPGEIQRGLFLRVDYIFEDCEK